MLDHMRTFIPALSLTGITTKEELGQCVDYNFKVFAREHLLSGNLQEFTPKKNLRASLQTASD